MAPIITTARIVCKDKNARQKVFAAFHKIVEYSQANEPGVLRYIVTVPLDDKAENELYMIEHYASADASTAHIATPPVQELIALFTTSDVLAGAPEVFNSVVKHSKRPDTTPPLSANPAIILKHFGYKSGTMAHALEGWGAVVDFMNAKEEGTRAYEVCEEDNGQNIRTVEFYDSWEYMEKIHNGSSAVVKNQEHNGKDRTGVKGDVRVRAVDGFLSRNGGGSKL